ncbi:putative F-box/LRR-repeat protein 23 [Solanum pennellii]|uniref:F-box/LRR-repeat protein 23 n=1 Tax=Solanum pennellii TaxID=28526 RepID=A0ABM1HDX1_SOLPN|nr:putative F-box/LRR-repeat protein 23 [Solanum pennellii]
MKVCHGPAMWRVIDLKYESHFSRMSLVLYMLLDRMYRIAVDRSQGKLLIISIQNFGSRELLNYIAKRSSQLRYLKLVKCFNIAGGLAVAAKNLPLLEELHIHLTFISEEDIESVGRYCPLLNSFTLNASEYDTPVNLISADDGQALDIAKSMPELRHLALIANTLTNVGLEAILDGCPHLLSLDLRCCYNIDLEGDLGKRCREQIVDRKQPCASCQDYEFYSEFSHYCFSNDDSTFRD